MRSLILALILAAPVGAVEFRPTGGGGGLTTGAADARYVNEVGGSGETVQGSSLTVNDKLKVTGEVQINGGVNGSGVIAGSAGAQFGGVSASTFTAAGLLQLVAGSTTTGNGTISISTSASASVTGTPNIFIDKSGNIGFNSLLANTDYDYLWGNTPTNTTFDAKMTSLNGTTLILDHTGSNKTNAIWFNGGSGNSEIAWEAGNLRMCIDNNSNASCTGAPFAFMTNSIRFGVGTINPGARIHSSSGTLLLDGNGAKIMVSSNTSLAVSGCGTNPILNGLTDVAGKLTIGGGGATACEVTFQTAYSAAPICICQDETTAVATRASATTTAMTCSGVLSASDVINYICIGFTR